MPMEIIGLNYRSKESVRLKIIIIIVLLFSKDALNQSKVTDKCCSF